MSDAYNHPGLVGARPKRHSASGGYPSGRRTRARIIAAALRVFGERGYERASTRQIAERAGINTPAIQYYFGGKQGLYAACTRHVIGRVSSHLALPLLRAGDALRTAEPAAALDGLCELIAAVVDGLAIAGSENWNRQLAYVTQDGGTPAQTLFHNPSGAGLFDTIGRLIAVATGHTACGRLTRLRACVLLGQVSSLYENRTHMLAAMGWSIVDEDALALIKSVVCEHTRGALATFRASSSQLSAIKAPVGLSQAGDVHSRGGHTLEY
jgi:TetR/AcrR family transcriptional regulator, regulator of cefoperazone and chloramphenicol sensitivity